MRAASLASEFAPAKVNLALHVTGRRADGYHELESLIVFAGLADAVDASEADADSLVITGPFAAGLGAGPGNLVLRAVAGFRERWPGAVRTGLALCLTKNLPVAAGIGGGSADAAAALRLMARLSTQPVALDDLASLAAGLGADVPACLLSAPLLAKGIGERLTPLPMFPAAHIVLINPMVPLATADVFRRLAQRDNPALPPLPEPLARPVQLGLWLAETRNDLQPPAVDMVPVIGDIIAALGEAPGCILARMSGSGATVFGLFGAEGQAHQAARTMREKYPGHWVAAAPLLEP